MTLYRGGGLSRVFCTSRTLPSCSCLAIAAQETLPFDIPKIDDNNRFFKSTTVCVLRYANSRRTVANASFPLAKLRRSDDSAGPAGTTLGNRNGRLVQIAAPGIRPQDVPTRHEAHLILRMAPEFGSRAWPRRTGMRHRSRRFRGSGNPVAFVALPQD